MSSTDEPIQQDSDQPPVFELEHVDVYAQYLLTTPAEIVFVLRSMIKHGAMATVYFNHGKSFFMTMVLGLAGDEKGLYLDLGSSPEVNRLALGSDRLIVTTMVDSVKVQFVLKGLSQSTYENRNAFFSPLPESLLRLQRREYFRLETPIARPLLCQIKAMGPNDVPKSLELPLLDISGGGIGLKAAVDQLEFFEPETVFKNCRLALPEEGTIEVDLCVRSVAKMDAKAKQPYLRVGCEFQNLSGRNLMIIQRYITRIERERKAKQIR